MTKTNINQLCCCQPNGSQIIYLLDVEMKGKFSQINIQIRKIIPNNQVFFPHFSILSDINACMQPLFEAQAIVTHTWSICTTAYYHICLIITISFRFDAEALNTSMC